MITEPISVREGVNNVRKSLKELGVQLLDVKGIANASEVAVGEDRGEVMANIMLAYRHMEDASMRLGKVFQALDGGMSVYDKESAMGVAPQQQ